MARARNTAASRKHVEDESSPEVVYDTEWSATPLLLLLLFKFFLL
jgi:hypothetical protein